MTPIRPIEIRLATGLVQEINITKFYLSSLFPSNLLFLIQHKDQQQSIRVADTIVCIPISIFENLSLNSSLRSTMNTSKLKKKKSHVPVQFLDVSLNNYIVLLALLLFRPRSTDI